MKDRTKTQKTILPVHSQHNSTYSKIINACSTFIVICSFPLTGFPKAAIITHLRTLVASLAFAQCGAVSQDIMYVTLPLYHISASLLGISGCIQLGNIYLLVKFH